MRTIEIARWFVLASLFASSSALAQPTGTTAPAESTAATTTGTTPARPIAPSFEVIDRGDAVEVIARNVKAARTGITPIRSRLEVPVLGHPRAPADAPKDPTVKQIELAGAEQRVLSVKLDFDRAEVKTLSRYAQALQVGDDLHLLVPRKVPDGAAPVVLPEPTLPPEIAAKIEAKIEATRPPPGAPATASTLPNHAVSATPPAPAAPPPSTSPSAPDAAAPSVAAPPRQEAPPKSLARPAAPDPWSKITMYAAAGLALAGCAAWLVRRRKGLQAPGSPIDVIAQRSLGGKARIVWLSAGAREMIVAVTPQQVRMLGQWRKQDAPTGLPEALALDHVRDRLAERTSASAIPGGAPAAPSAGSSSAVAGIMRLRAQTVQPPEPTEEELAAADTEADATWAKELLAATTRARRGAFGSGSEGNRR